MSEFIDEYCGVSGKILKNSFEYISKTFMIISSLLQKRWFILDVDVQLKYYYVNILIR